MPASINASFEGTAAAFQTSLANEPILILAALITVYIVLGVLYESYIHPITIISTLPSAGVGALLALLITRIEFSVIALIGIILLIGIVQKNAIMMIDFALQAERDEGKPAEDAIFQACLLRFRPIIMTTMAALLGGLPLALGGGVGAELRMPLGITIVGGLMLSQMLTLFTTPVVYLYFDKLAQRLRPRERGRSPRTATGQVRTEGAGSMHLSAPFIKRPVATSLLSLALLLAGSVAYSVLPVASLPDVDYPVIGVGAGLPGASPETMASAVATPLERQFGRIAGVNQMTSTSSLGSASVTLQFDINRDINAAARDVQAAINAARSQLPSYLPQNPSYRKANPADAPILILTLTSDVVPKPQIYDMADSILAQKMSQIQGVGQVFVGGSSSPAVRVELNPMQLGNNGIGLEAVRTALAGRQRQPAQGRISGRQTTAGRSATTTRSSRPAIMRRSSPAITSRPARRCASADLGTVTDSVANIHDRRRGRHQSRSRVRRASSRARCC